MTKTVWGYADELSMGLCDEFFTEEVILTTPRSCRTQLLLEMLATRLYRGDVVLFTELVKMMQMYKMDADLQQLASRMQSKFEALSQIKPIGMIDVMY